MDDCICRHPGGLELTEHMIRMAELKSGAKTADIGCGCGLSLRLMREKYGLDAVGVEPDAQTNTLAGCPVYRGTAENLPFDDHALDALLCECVLSLTDDRTKALNELSRVIKKDGILMISDLYSRLDKSTDQSLPTRKNIIAQAEAAGFTLLYLEDHTKALTEMVVHAIMNDQDIQSLCEKDCQELKRQKCGYYILLAKKAGDS